MAGNDYNDRISEDQTWDQGDYTAARGQGWMPSSLQAPFLCSVAALFLLLSIVLECIRQYSDRKQGLIVFKTTAELPTSISVAYIYVPTAVAVLAVTLWNVSASDALRLEPYFQLAKAEGVAAAVLFTNYSFCNGVMAPLIAARNHHWLVFFTSGLSILLRIFLPSLFSGLLVLTEMTSTQAKPVNTWPNLLDVDTQKARLSGDAFRHHSNVSAKMTADDIFLLRSSDYATAPMSIPLEENDKSMLSVNQTVYWAELACQQVTSTGLKPPDSDGFWNISGMEFPSLGDGNRTFQCYVDVSFGNITANQRLTSQVLYWEPVHSQHRLQQPPVFSTRGCQSFSLLGMLLDLDVAVNGTANSGATSNATAFACSATYISAEAELYITVNSSIVEAKLHTSTERKLTGIDFAHAEFQNLLLSEYHLSPPAMLQMPGGAAEVGPNILATPHPRPRAWTSTDRIDVIQYQGTIIRYWKQKFITTMNKFFNPTAAPTIVNARQVARVMALAVISRTALMAEAILLAAAVLLVSLAVIYPIRLNFLRGDPGSIAAQCGIIADLFPPDTVLARSDAQFHSATTRQLSLWSKGFRCEWMGDQSDRKVNIVPLKRHLGAEPLSLPAARRGRDPWPHFLVLHWFLVECMLLIGVLAAFGFALSSLRLDGIDNASPKVLALTIFLIYGPTVVSSLISTLLASILRHLSVLDPWMRLERGMARATESLTLNYGSQTAIAVLQKSGRRTPLLLTVLSVTCILNLLLNVVSGGVFEPRLKQYQRAASGLFSTQYNDSVFHAPSMDIEFDGYGLIVSSVVTGSPLLPWTTPAYSFLPLTANEINETDVDGSASYSALTLGVGAILECHQIPTDQSWTDSETGKVYLNHTPFSGVTCTAESRNSNVDGGLIRRSIAYLLPTRDSAVTPCQMSIFVLAQWTTRNPASMNIQESLALYCAPSIRVDEFEVLFDNRGTISSYKRSVATTGLRGQISGNASESLRHFNRALAGISLQFPAQREPSCYRYDWLGLLTAFAYQSLDSGLDSFNPALLVRAVQSTYQSIFSSYLTFARDIYFDRYRSPAIPVVDGIIITRLWDMSPSTSSIIIIIALLSIDFSVLVLVFVLRYKLTDGPRIPKSVGSLVPWVAHSRVAPEFIGMSQMTDSERRCYLRQRNRRYTFGLTLCPDGKERWQLDYDSRYLKEEDQ